MNARTKHKIKYSQFCLRNPSEFLLTQVLFDIINMGWEEMITFKVFLSLAFQYLHKIFPRLSEAKIKSVFVGPQIKDLFRDPQFEKILQDKEKKRFGIRFVKCATIFLGTRRPNTTKN